MLAVNDLSVRYGMHQALISVNLQVSRDEIVVILGANGAGKSTLLSAIAGNCVGELNGSISLGGETLTGLDAAQVVERGIAYVPEGRGVFADLSVEENLQLGSYAEHARGREEQSLRDVLALFPKLDERKKQTVRTMSGGEQQMVAIGRALMSAPSILMLDEPSLGLSPLLCKELFSSLKQVRDSGVGILLVEQNAKQSLSISDRGYLLGNGKIIGQDSAQQLLNDPDVHSAYLGGSSSTARTSKLDIDANRASGATNVSQPISANTNTTKPKITVIADLLDAPEQNNTKQVPVTINPVSNQRSSQTVSSDSLLTEDISDIVARASSSAADLRTADAALPMQVVKLSSDKASASHPTGLLSSGLPKSDLPDLDSRKSVMPKTRLPVSGLPTPQDAEIQALLDEFETAAQNAASSVGTGKDTDVATPVGSSSNQIDDDLPLPHIPVYKKSSVTVYRRDGGGHLRKQD